MKRLLSTLYVYLGLTLLFTILLYLGNVCLLGKEYIINNWIAMFLVAHVTSVPCAIIGYLSNFK